MMGLKLLCACGRWFWGDRNEAKAREWFERAVQYNPDLGDAWAYYLAFEMHLGTKVGSRHVLHFYSNHMSSFLGVSDTHY